uniref:Uncharacterized protein n=1 Tax=Chromera velia CCMP2878 TaxID=1169474 RepID=A0A0G4I5C2_9ALVE|eukprot:Cvel_11135.t1-p1 / transcript=Cvel_11135.t1 / gene=Cvel_11135 / organism=Chromera_velia_CCMP2878 / gene_product=hypothetical protein / transcript_product=hypothetical protein / location=Cvel_scaffold690:27085-31269(+) / protein_length=121 / sequence_SO=supercontig / SO=protein_coding / is_pseudo=false
MLQMYSPEIDPFPSHALYSGRTLLHFSVALAELRAAASFADCQELAVQEGGRGEKPEGIGGKTTSGGPRKKEDHCQSCRESKLFRSFRMGLRSHQVHVRRKESPDQDSLADSASMPTAALP